MSTKYIENNEKKKQKREQGLAVRERDRETEPVRGFFNNFFSLFILLILFVCLFVGSVLFGNIDSCWLVSSVCTFVV